ncbi:Lanosterol 14-alpha-demethylase [Mycena sanguinolenta]|uniref:cyclin-dependent kinase n=1 Tax=Mycena sanguinolenta TaxID=230812 RepID=A0A8H6XI87_9AGAR|nr:Lanosterol 14-alpha-demethylase [Mycena sanguinolenta]
MGEEEERVAAVIDVNKPGLSVTTTIPDFNRVLMASEDALHDVTDDRYELIEEGPASTVSRTWTALEGREPQWIVAKCATVRRKFSKEPHDIVKELRILSNLSHMNIVSELSHFEDTKASMLTIYVPYIPFSLVQFFANPSFAPFSSSFPPIREPTQEATLIVIAKSITFQLLRALAYLHDPARRIAHRDVKPANILLTPEGRVILIDFGVAWDGEGSSQDDLWPEEPGHMYFEVSTGAYRAPELLFGTRAYDAAALDMWSAGAVLAEMFSTLRLCSNDDEAYDEEPVYSAQAGDGPFVVPHRLRVGQPETYWCRDTLFNGRRGEIGLAWSIFKIRGTPTSETWPTFRDLPGASSVDFMVVPKVPLASFLPNLPANSAPVLDLMEDLLAYPPTQRLSARDALQHAWFGGQILLPPSYPDEDERIVSELDGQNLTDVLGGLMA